MEVQEGILRNKVVKAGRRENFWGDRVYMEAGHKYMNGRGKALAWLAVAAAGFGIFSNEGLGAWGHGTKWRADASMLREAKAKYALALEQASPSQLFAMRFLDTSHVSVQRTAVHHSGIAGFFDTPTNTERQYDIGDSCLNNTAFDINGGQINFHVRYSGLLSSVNVDETGGVPTAAAVASYNPADHILTVRSGNARPEDLRFDVEGTALKPLDTTTQNLLGTYGCETAIQYTHENTAPSL